MDLSKPAIANADYPAERICKLIAREASINGLPLDFFARLIWKESRFDASAISPKGAQGIAQFMPETAKAEGLKNPFDPEQAIPASARLLSRLRVKTGNLGLAAAAYNAGEQRVIDWLQQGGTLPIETKNYIFDITGEAADRFYNRRYQVKKRKLDKKLSFLDACIQLPLRYASTNVTEGNLKTPWVIQIGGSYNKTVAKRIWQKIKKHNQSVIGDLPFAISLNRTTRGNRSIYTVKLGAASRIKANTLCAQLRIRGVSCIVQRN